MFLIRLVYLVLVWMGIVYLIKLWKKYRLTRSSHYHTNPSSKRRNIKSEIHDAEFEEID